MIYLLVKKTEQFCRLCKTIRLLCLPRVAINRCVIMLLLCGAIHAGAQTQSNFRTESGVAYIQVLSAAPTPTSAGAIYINSADHVPYWYDGSKWVSFTATLAPDGTVINTITTSTGRVWMDRNLGATRVATSKTDANAYGSLFQWCRGADGHQLRGSSVQSSQIAATTTGNANFIQSYGNWSTTSFTDGSLWWNGSVAGANNPCSAGYHVPTQAEWNSEMNAGLNTTDAAYNILKLIYAGLRTGSNASINYTDGGGYYWTSTLTGGIPNNFFITSGTVCFVTGNVVSTGLSVRCIKNQ